MKRFLIAITCSLFSCSLIGNILPYITIEVHGESRIKVPSRTYITTILGKKTIQQDREIILDPSVLVFLLKIQFHSSSSNFQNLIDIVNISTYKHIISVEKGHEDISLEVKNEGLADGTELNFNFGGRYGTLSYVLRRSKPNSANFNYDRSRKKIVSNEIKSDNNFSDGKYVNKSYSDQIIPKEFSSSKSYESSRSYNIPTSYENLTPRGLKSSLKSQEYSHNINTYFVQLEALTEYYPDPVDYKTVAHFGRIYVLEEKGYYKVLLEASSSILDAEKLQLKLKRTSKYNEAFIKRKEFEDDKYIPLW